MRTAVPLMLCAALLPAAGCGGAPIGGPSVAPRVVADRLYWGGPEGNLAFRIGGKFNTRREMIGLLSLDAPIGRWQGRVWVLADVLVSLDCNGNGDVGTWIVSGPGPLISKYVAGLRGRYDKREIFYDFDAVEMDVKLTAHFEREEE